MKAIGDAMKKVIIFAAVGIVGLGVGAAIRQFESWNSGKSMAEYADLDATEKQIWKGIARYCGPGNDDIALYACKLHRDELVEFKTGIRPEKTEAATQGDAPATEASQMERAAKAAGPIFKDLKEVLGDKESM